MPNTKLKRFVKHVARAAKKQPTNVQSSLKDLRDKLNQSLINEDEILHEVNDSEDIVVDKIQHLESELKKTEQLRDEERSTSTTQINNLQQDISSLRNKISDLIEFKTDRDRRFKQIEKKIKSKVMKNYDEIVLIEEQIQKLESRYDKIKKSDIHDKELLHKLEDKIKELKHKLMMRKAGIPDVHKMKFHEHIPKKRQRIKHHMAISPDVDIKRDFPKRKMKLTSWHDLEASEPKSVFSKFRKKRHRH